MLKKILIGMITLLGAIEAIASDTSTHPAAPVNTQVVRYDATTDRLSFDVHTSPLTQLLARISHESGVKILADPGIDHPVTASLQNQPLESALGYLTRGMNVVMIHDQREVPGQGLKMVLTRVELLPAGQGNRALLRRVPNSGDAAMPYAGKPESTTGLRAGRFHSARSQARLQRRQERAAQTGKVPTQTAESDRKAQHQQKRMDRLNRLLAQAQTLAATNPEASQQRIQKINQKIARIQQRQEKTAGASSP